MPGKPGAGGKGGKGGAGGYPGRGGQGGAGGKGGPPVPYKIKSGRSSITMYEHTGPGRSGTAGKSGKYGRSGNFGLSSGCGQQGQNGGLLWVVSTPGGMKTSSTRYDAKVEGLMVAPVLNGGVFEPNGRITVSGVVVHNAGGLDLPEGASLSMCSLHNVYFNISKCDIPQKYVKAGQKSIIPFNFSGHLSDLDPPNEPGLRTFKAQFHSKIELLGRTFEESVFMKELLVQYPVQLGKLSCPKIMKQGNVSIVSVEVKNLSSLPYGSGTNSGGKVVLQLCFDPRLIPLGKVNTGARDVCVVRSDRNLKDYMFIEFLLLPPKQKVTVNIEVRMDSNAELFDKCLWRADLYLREKMVEYNQETIRVTSKYDMQKSPADALLVINEDMTHQKYEFWCYILHLFGVSFDVWDTALYNGFSTDNSTGLRHQNSWYGRYHGKLIIYSHCNDLKFLTGADIAHHFYGATFREKPLKELDSSLVVFMPFKCSELKVLQHLAKVQPKVNIPEGDYGGSHLVRPTARDKPPPYKNCERKLVKMVEENNLSQAPLLLSRTVNITQINLLKYSYGCVDIRQVPIMKSSKFLVVSNSNGLDASILSSTTDIMSLATKYGQTILAILYGISISSKLNIIKKRANVPNDAVFYLPNSSIMGMEELAMICLAWEVADELYSLSGEALRMTQIYGDIINNVTAYVECGHVVLRGLKLIDQEFEKRRSAGLKHYLVTQAYSKITKMSKGIQKVLREEGVSFSKLEDLPSFDQLQNHIYAHLCHQHLVKDDLWNLADN